MGIKQADLKKEEKEEQLDGDAGINKFFKEIYGGEVLCLLLWAARSSSYGIFPMGSQRLISQSG